MAYQPGAKLYSTETTRRSMCCACHATMASRPPALQSRLAPFADLLDPLQMAWDANKLKREFNWQDDYRLDEALDWLADIRAGRFGGHSMPAEQLAQLEQYALQRVQEPFLSNGQLTPYDVAVMFRAGSTISDGRVSGSTA